MPLAYHTAHHMSGLMSGLNAPLYVQRLASLTHRQRPTRHSGHSPSVCPTTLEMACFRGTRWPDSQALISVFAKEAMHALSLYWAEEYGFRVEGWNEQQETRNWQCLTSTARGSFIWIISTTHTESERKSAHAIPSLLAAPQACFNVSRRTAQQSTSVTYAECHGVSYEWYGGE